MDSGGSRVPCLDGLRGIAALWVLVGHSLMLTGWRVPVLAEPDLGVELFIMLSGFLMVHQYELKPKKEPWGAPAAWLKFWTRRFFRIAPLYYVALAAALLSGPMLFADRMEIDSFLGRSPQMPHRYLDGSVTNILAHLSFLFGFHPAYSFRTPLPDWSLALEMQFYAAFPFLMLVTRRLGWAGGTMLLAALSAGVVLAMHSGSVRFPMPAFLPLKLHIFLCGMLLAAAVGVGRTKALSYLALALLFVLIPIGTSLNPTKAVVRLLLVGSFFLLVHPRLAPGAVAGAVAGVARTLGNRFFYWLGELSYGTYLIHLLILQPLAAFVIGRFGHDLSAPARFGLVILLLVPAVYSLAWLTYRTVEVPGRDLGRRLLGRFGRRPARPGAAQPVAP